ncbi:hypothetical protein KI387_041994, partial [Taxus chinensis]
MGTLVESILKRKYEISQSLIDGLKKEIKLMEADHGQTLKEMESFVENVSKYLKDKEDAFLKHEEELRILK